jgi:glycosyltransferase involved in cell wall biosynthesis
LTVTVITRNESAHIEACLASVDWADERLVVDCGSTDDTVALAQRAGARVVTNPWPGYAAQKNFAASQATHDWILSIDADERVTPELADEVRARLGATPAAAGYRVPRMTWHLGRWFRTTDWYPDYQLRLYDRRRGRWTARRVHESVQIDGTPADLRHHLRHYA